VAEEYADGGVTRTALAKASGASYQPTQWCRCKTTGAREAALAAYYASRPTERVGSMRATKIEIIAGAWHFIPGDLYERLRVGVALLRDIFGNPVRPVVLDPAWRTPTVLALAQAAYIERTFPSGTLDVARLAVLADALEDAGCDNADILSHLRGPGPHVRGCWVVDLLTERS